jgi:hypothetical protein
MTLSIGDHNRQAYVVVRQTESGLCGGEYDSKDEALESISADDYKCMLVCVEYDGGGVYHITLEDYT